MDAQAWIGPAIVAAVISSIITVAGWLVNYRTSIGLEQRKRDEKIRDFQIALRAEIRSELRNLSGYDLASQMEAVRGRYAQGQGYSVVVPRPAKPIVFEAIVNEIHILPEAVIDPVVLFARQRQAIVSLVDDMKDANFRSLSVEQQLAMYRDYLSMWEAWREFALQAEAALAAQSAQSACGTAG